MWSKVGGQHSSKHGCGKFPAKTQDLGWNLYASNKQNHTEASDMSQLHQYQIEVTSSSLPVENRVSVLRGEKTSFGASTILQTQYLAPSKY